MVQSIDLRIVFSLKGQVEVSFLSFLSNGHPGTAKAVKVAKSIIFSDENPEF